MTRRTGHSRGLKNQLWFKLFGRAKLVECHWCKRQLIFNDATVDHLIPYREWKQINRDLKLRYIVLSCYDCNHTRDRILTVLKNADGMAERLLKMATGKIKIIGKYENLLEQLEEKTLEACKELYLHHKLKQFK